MIDTKMEISYKKIKHGKPMITNILDRKMYGVQLHNKTSKLFLVVALIVLRDVMNVTDRTTSGSITA